jgi:hypothetical protein
MMRKRRIRRRWIIYIPLTLVALFLLVTGILVVSSAKPPLETFAQCRQAISHAHEVEAEQYAPELLQEAEGNYQSAMAEWQVQNERLFFLRDYELTIQHAITATEKAKEASLNALVTKDSLQKDVTQELKIVQKKIDTYESGFAYLPLNKLVRNEFTLGKLKFLECEEAYERGDFQKVRDNLAAAKKLVSEANQEAHHLLDSYFNNYHSWRRWADETIDWSKDNHGTALLVDKLAHRLYVYQNGKVTRDFQIELGINWMGDKRYRGDKATPEGRYHITKKKNHRETKYYKALLINYPNDEDREAYTREVKRGTVSRRSSIGNIIEFHGEGGRGINWTEGCIALTNDEIDKLFDLTTIGTPVTIVGSLRSLQEINGN